MATIKPNVVVSAALTSSAVTPMGTTASIEAEQPPSSTLRRWGLWRPARAWASTVAVALAWQLASSLDLISPTVLPPPSALLGTTVSMIADGSLVEGLWVSLTRVLGGSAIGLALGLGLGLAAGFTRVGEDVVDRPIQMLRTIPFTALTPLLILWFGLGETSKVLLVVIATVVPMYINTFSGVRGVDGKLVEVARAYRLSSRQVATRVLLPGALAPILVGVRYALGVAWVAVIVAETVNASAGIGYLLTNARTYARTDIMMVCIAIYAILGLLTDAMVRAAEKSLLQWRAPVVRGERV